MSTAPTPLYFFFFKAEDGIRDDLVTGVQTCALPIPALHIGSRKILSDLVHRGHTADCSDKDARKLVETYIDTPEEKEQRQPYVVGGDYFSQSQYSGVRKSEDGIFSKFASKAREEGYQESETEEFNDFCTETLAKIYLEQDYKEQAIDIYSKLSL